MTTLMACGHVANGVTGPDNAPVCVIDAGTARDTEARTVAPEPDLTGRKSKCICGRIANSDGTRDDGTREWRGAQPFLRLNPDHNPEAGKYDEHYCGHAGWD